MASRLIRVVAGLLTVAFAAPAFAQELKSNTRGLLLKPYFAGVSLAVTEGSIT